MITFKNMENNFDLVLTRMQLHIFLGFIDNGMIDLNLKGDSVCFDVKDEYIQLFDGLNMHLSMDEESDTFSTIEEEDFMSVGDEYNETDDENFFIDLINEEVTEESFLYRI